MCVYNDVHRLVCACVKRAPFSILGAQDDDRQQGQQSDRVRQRDRGKSSHTHAARAGGGGTLPDWYWLCVSYTFFPVPPLSL